VPDENSRGPLYDDAKLTPENLAALSPEDRLASEMAARLDRDRSVETAIFDGTREHDARPVQPVKLTAGDTFRFRCHRGIPCWNACCYGADVTLTPYDILTLARHFGIKPAQFVADYTVPAMHEGSNLPVPKLVMTGKDGGGPCVFVDDEIGCTVYDSRPATCRYYPLGLGVMKMKGHDEKQDMFFLVKETHCKGHAEAHQQTVGEFRKGQGIEIYDLLNERWVEILMKMASWRSVGGPAGRDVSKQTKKMFYMVSTDIDAFRRFVFETRFLATYEIDDDMVRSIETSDETLLQLGFDWLRNVMFNEDTIAMKADVLQASIAAARGNAGGV